MNFKPRLSQFVWMILMVRVFAGIAQADNSAPFIAGVTNQTQVGSAVLGPLKFTVFDPETAAGSLSVGAASSNGAVVPVASIVLGGAGTNRTVTITPASNQYGTSMVTLVVSDGAMTGSLRFAVTINNSTVVNGNAPPVIGGIANQVVATGQKMGPLNFVVGDLATNNGSLVVTAASTNPNLTPTIQLGGTGSSRTVAVTPASGVTGQAMITLTATDGSGLTASTAFILTVTGTNSPPVLSALPNQLEALGITPPLLNFTVGDNETSPDKLWIATHSSNEAILPDSGLVVGGVGTARTLTFAPVGGQTGVATVTITATDEGGMTATGQFLFAVLDQGAPSAQFLRLQGIYSLDSALGGTYNGYSLRDANIRNYSFVDGYVLHVPWNNVESSPGVYDFFIIQNALNKLPAGQKLSLIISPNEPAYIAAAAGVTTWVDMTNGTPVTRAVPWDSYLRQRRDALLHALATTTFNGIPFQSDSRLAIINPFLPGGSGGLRDPSPLQPLSSLPGYSRLELLGAVQDELRTLTTEFPLAYSQIGFWPILDNENASYGGTSSWDWIRQQLLAEFNGLIRPHIGFFMDNLAASRTAPQQDPITGLPVSTFAIPMYNSRDAEFNGFEALCPWIQPFNSATTNNAPKVLNGIPADGLEMGYNTYHMCYVEIYAIDLDAVSFQPLLQHWHDFYQLNVPNPLSDEDGDGLPLFWEQASGLNPRFNVGNDGATGDPDGDQQTNYQEYLAGTQPLDPNSRLAINHPQWLPNGSFTASFSALAGKTYTIKFSDDLLHWNVLLNYSPITSGETAFTDPSPGAKNRFYRLITPAEP